MPPHRAPSRLRVPNVMCRMPKTKSDVVRFRAMGASLPVAAGAAATRWPYQVISHAEAGAKHRLDGCGKTLGALLGLPILFVLIIPPTRPLTLSRSEGCLPVPPVS